MIKAQCHRDLQVYCDRVTSNWHGAAQARRCYGDIDCGKVNAACPRQPSATVRAAETAYASRGGETMSTKRPDLSAYDPKHIYTYGWQWHRTGSRWSPVRTLPVEPLWCDLGFVPNSGGNKAAGNLRPMIGSGTRTE